MPSTASASTVALAHPPLSGLLAARCAPPRPQTMLLVEDSRFAAEAVRLICRRAGLRLRRADTLAAARQHLRVYRPDIALIDLGLPDGSGLELIDGLNRAKPRIGRIVAISGDPVLERAAQRAGADAFVEKPLCLAEHLHKLLGAPIDLGEALVMIDHSLGLPASMRVPGNAPCTPPPSDTDSQTEHATGIWRDRNMGADPLALHDDLVRAHDLLAHGAEPARIGYAAQFLSGIARSLDDRKLMALAERVRRSGEAAPLLLHLRRRVTAAPPI